MSQNLPASSAPTRACDLISTTSSDRTATSGNRSAASATPTATRRISSATLMGAGRALEIEHGGRVYQLRITQLNKLILTA